MSHSANSVSTSAADKAKLVTLLRESKARFVDSFAGVADDQCRLHPGEGRWSVLDTVEHITLAEKGMLKLITATRRPKSESTPNREEAFLKMVSDRSRKTESPELARPKGRYASLDEARAHFERARDETIHFVEQCNEDLRATEVTHPHPLAGVVTTYEMLIVMAKHAERHALQIDEIKQSPAFHAAAGRS